MFGLGLPGPIWHSTSGVAWANLTVGSAGVAAPSKAGIAFFLVQRMAFFGNIGVQPGNRLRGSGANGKPVILAGEHTKVGPP